MSIKICTSNHFLSTVAGTGPRKAYLPGYSKGSMFTSDKDGEIKRAPDPVTMIDDSLYFYNNGSVDIQMYVTVMRSNRSIISTNPVTVIIHDAWSWAVGESPNAEFPSVSRDSFGGKLQIDKAKVGGKDLRYGRVFLDCDDSRVKVDVGVVKAGEALDFRYSASVQTPGLWTSPTEHEARYEAKSQWVKLTASHEPVLV